MSGFDPKATALRMEQLLLAMGKSGCRWDVRLHQMLLLALRKLLPLTDAEKQPLPIKNLHTNPTLRSEIARTLPPELCSSRRVRETLKNLLYARAFLDVHGESIADVYTPLMRINENTDDLKAGLIAQALRCARTVEGGLSLADARPLAWIIFGKGRPDFPTLVQCIQDAITENSACTHSLNV